MRIVDKLMRARERMGLTRDEVARVVGVDGEDGAIGLSDLAKLAALYGHTVDYFLTDMEEDPVDVVFAAGHPSISDLEIVAWAKGLVLKANELDRLLGAG